jgi:hypothetical protein
LALVIEEDPACCLHGTFDLQYNETEDRWQSWTPGGDFEPIGGPSGICGIINWLILTCGSDNDHVNVQFNYTDVSGGSFTANADVAITCDPSFETDYITIPSNPLAPGLCEGGFFQGAKLRIIAV